MTEKRIYRIARICLTDGTVQVLEPGDDLVQSFLGGKGLGFRLMQEYRDALMFLTGPLTEAFASCGGRYCAVTCSPVTGKLIAPTSGSAWGAALKQSGLDGVILEGNAPEWTWFRVDSNSIQVCNAAEIMGMSPQEAQEWLNAKCGSTCSALTIGQAGENQVPLAAIFCGSQRAFGRDGIGAVMGRKKVKAIAVCGAENALHSCARCTVRCGHAEAGSESALCNHYGLDAMGFARVFDTVRELSRRGTPGIPDWDAENWAANISCPRSELSRLAGSGAEALCRALGGPPEGLHGTSKTARSGLKNKLTKEMSAVLDAMGCCLFSAVRFSPRDYADWLSAAAGQDFTEKDLLRIGRAICELETSLQRMDV